MSADRQTSAVGSLIDTPISRRRALQIAAAAGAAAFLGGTSASRVTAQDPAPVGGNLKVATWLGYMDYDANGYSPSLEKFRTDTGITIDYQETIDGNEEFFTRDLQGPLSNGLSTGWDLMVITDDLVQKLLSFGWLEPILIEAPVGSAAPDSSPAPGGGVGISGAMPNYPLNLLDIYKTREWDRDNVYAAPYVSGMTGLGYDQNVTGPRSNLDILFAPEFAGRMTYLTEFRDTVGLSALRLGFDPTTITEEQFQAALAPIKVAVDQEIVRNVPGQSYVNDMAAGDVVLAAAWSGDIVGTLQPAQTEAQDFQWTLADQGGMLWTDNMAIPKGAVNKAQAQAFINWYYDPVNAAQIGAFIQYVVPVTGADKAMLDIDPELAANTLIFPDAAMIARLHQFRSLDPDTALAWTNAFDDVIGL